MTKEEETCESRIETSKREAASKPLKAKASVGAAK
jgi:hypothetical protein